MRSSPCLSIVAVQQGERHEQCEQCLSEKGSQGSPNDMCTSRKASSEWKGEAPTSLEVVAVSRVCMTPDLRGIFS